MNKLSILTPTYNRSNLLLRLFNSLEKQTCFDFEWVIVDDGSPDNTEEVVKTFKSDNFKITYLKKENGGKHTAINYGVKHINSEWTFIVDNDDYLVENAIEIIKTYIKKYNDNKKISSIAFLRMFPDGKINTDLSKNEFVGNYIQDRIYQKSVGDMAEIYRTSVLQEFPFPSFENEKFMGEDIVWIRIAKIYDMVFVPIPIYVCTYLDDGLTANRRKNSIKSSRSWYEISKEYLTLKKLPFKTKVKFILFLIIYGKYSQYSFKTILKDSNNYFMCIILYPCAQIIKLRWRKYNG